MDKWAPPYLIDEWDNTGFQIGNPEKEVEKVLLSLDIDQKVLKKAIKEKVQMIITHHPIIFKPLKNITRTTYKGKLIYDLIREDIVVYNAHTNLDLAMNGVNDALANILDIKDTRPLNTIYEEPLFKLVIFVPKSHACIIRKVLGDEGAGFIGNYSHCTYNTEGMGTFMPLDGTSPFIGKINKLEEVEETKIETIVEKKNLSKTLNEVIKIHPYDEVAYDIYPLKNKGNIYGYGRIGKVNKIPFINLVDRIKEKLKLDHLFVYGNSNGEITKVAVCGGSGSSFIHDAYLEGADVYITGDVRYHDAQYANELGLTIVDAGHYHTEKVILPIIKDYIQENTKNSIAIELYEESSAPYIIY